MAQKIFVLPEIGEVLVSKRKGAKNIRLSVKSNGQVRVGIPVWAPYVSGLTFARNRADWIIEHQAQNKVIMPQTGDRIGKSHRLLITKSPDNRLRTRLKGQEIVISVPPGTGSQQVQTVVTRASERALKKEAEKLLPPRLSELAARYGYSYSSLSIKKLTSRWGSCSNKKAITLNYFLMQLPWELIDYVILHELAHTKHFNHRKPFWDELGKAVPDARDKQKMVKKYKTAITSS